MRLEKYLSESTYGIIGGDDGGYNSKNRTQELKYDNVVKGMLKNYSDMLEYYDKTNCEILFMRGLRQRSNSDFALVKPSGHERMSAYTANYYTLITSHDPSWSKIPPRSQSLIGATNRGKAGGYGTLFVVVPKNGSKIGQAQSEDFWGTFKHVFGNESYPLGSFNKYISHLFNEIGISETPDTTLSDFKSACNDLDEYIDDNHKDSENPFKEIESNDYAWDEYSNILGRFYKGDFYKALLGVFDPDEGNILVTKAGEPLRNDVEVWTDGDCLMVAHKVFKQYLPELLSIAKTGEGRFNTQMFDQLKGIRIVKDWRGNY